MKLIFTLVVACLFISTSWCMLRMPREAKEKIKNYIPGSIASGANIPNTTCHLLNLTTLGQADMLAYGGHLKAINNDNLDVSVPYRNSSLGFVLYGSQKAKGDPKKLANYPLIIWLQGGPGDSSMIGNFHEMGPYFPTSKNPDDKWIKNDQSWTMDYNVLYIDNPIGVGLSYADSIDDVPMNQEQVAMQLVYGLNQLYNDKNGCFNAIGALSGMKNAKVYMFGETYAGKYIPAFAEYYYNQQKDFKFPLKGLGLGDPFTNPKENLKMLGFFAQNSAALDMIDRAKTEQYILQCIQDIRYDNWEEAQEMFDYTIYDILGAGYLEDIKNYRHFEEDDYPDLTELFDNDKMKTAFKIPDGITFEETSWEVNLRFTRDYMMWENQLRLEKALKADKNLKLLVYQGEYDLAICTPCTESWLDKLDHTKQNDFKTKEITPWIGKDTEGKEVIFGYSKSAGQVTFKIIAKAGQLAPRDQELATRKMVQEFIG